MPILIKLSNHLGTHGERDGLRVRGHEGGGAVAVLADAHVVAVVVAAVVGHDAAGGARPAGKHAVARRVRHGVALRQDCNQKKHVVSTLVVVVVVLWVTMQGPRT